MAKLPAKLPTRDDLGPLPSARSGRPVAKISNPGAVGEAMAGTGNAISRTGEKLSLALEARKEKDEAYEVEKRLLEFNRDRERELEEQRREMAPGGEGFGDSWRTSYDASARETFDQARKAGLSPTALQRLDLGLVRASEALHTRAFKHELDERNRFHREDLDTTLGGLYRDVEAAPGRLDQGRAQGLSLIENSRLAAADKYAVRRKFLRDLDNAAALSIINGAQTGADFRAAEGQLFASAPVRPQARDRSGSDFMRRPGAQPAQPPGGGPPQVVPPSERGIREERALGGPDMGETPYDAYGLVEPPTGPAPTSGGSPSGRLDIQPVPGNRSPRGARPREGSVEGIVLHHTGGSTLDSALSQNRLAGTGYNYYVDRDGTVYQFAPDDQRMVHIRNPGDRHRTAGQWDTLTQDNTVGISAVARNEDDITPEQREAMRRLTVQLANQHGVKPENIVGHGDIQGGPGGNREATEGSMAREFREGRIALGPEGGERPRAGDRPGAVRVAEGPGARTDATATGPRMPGTARPIWAAEEEGAATYNGPFQNLPLSERVARYRQLETRRRTISTALTQQIGRWEAGAGNGILPTDAEVAQVHEQVEAFDDPVLTQHFNSVMDLAALTRQARTLPPAQLEEMVRVERRRQMEQGASDVAQKRLNHMQQLLNWSRTEVERDPNGWAHTVGLADFSQPPDFNDDASMAAHAERARAVGRYLGQPPKFFSPNQRAAAADVARQGGEPMLGMLGAIVKNWGNDAPGAIAEFAQHDPELAYIGGMYLSAQQAGGANMQAVRDAARGAELRRDENFKKILSHILPKRADLDTAAQNVVGTAFQTSPQTMAAAIETANLIYATRASQKGLTTTFDDRMWSQALKEALGEHSANNVTYGGLYYQRRGLFGGNSGNPVLVPSHMRQDSPTQVLDTLRTEDLTDPFGEGPSTGPSVSPRGLTMPGTPLSMAALRRSTLVSVGDGRYWLAQGDPQSAEPMWVKTSSGANYVLDLNRLEPVLRQRRPDLFLGYVEPVSGGSAAPPQVP